MPGVVTQYFEKQELFIEETFSFPLTAEEEEPAYIKASISPQTPCSLPPCVCQRI